MSRSSRGSFDYLKVEPEAAASASDEAVPEAPKGGDNAAIVTFSPDASPASAPTAASLPAKAFSKTTSKDYCTDSRATTRCGSGSSGSGSRSVSSRGSFDYLEDEPEAAASSSAAPSRFSLFTDAPSRFSSWFSSWTVAGSPSRTSLPAEALSRTTSQDDDAGTDSRMPGSILSVTLNFIMPRSSRGSFDHLEDEPEAAASSSDEAVLLGPGRGDTPEAPRGADNVGILAFSPDASLVGSLASASTAAPSSSAPFTDAPSRFLSWSSRFSRSP